MIIWSVSTQISLCLSTLFTMGMFYLWEVGFSVFSTEQPSQLSSISGCTTSLLQIILRFSEAELVLRTEHGYSTPLTQHSWQSVILLLSTGKLTSPQCAVNSANQPCSGISQKCLTEVQMVMYRNFKILKFCTSTSVLLFSIT
jgi:hypothetical protein